MKEKEKWARRGENEELIEGERRKIRLGRRKKKRNELVIKLDVR